MNIALWIVASLLAAVFGLAGIFKLSSKKDALKSKGLDWVDDFSANTVKLIGGLELAAAIGLILPPLTKIAPILAPLAALGLALIMVGAIITHARRKEPQGIAVNVVLLLLAAFVVWGRFGPYSF
ncbi:MAG: DoxX family protein [Actinomycetia bacterium]|nr:DoxX family protein [Actinomycetes bacterium]MDQ1652437.1 hypothetical protein [Cryptosporangiaceae bacterium]